MNNWIPRITVVRKMIDRSGALTARHCHDYIQAGYVQTGRLKIELGKDKIIELCSGDFFVIAQGQEHRIGVLGAEDVHSIDLRFKAVISRIKNSNIDISGSKELEKWITTSFKIRRGRTKRIVNLLDKMLGVSGNYDETQNFILSVYLLQLSALVSKLKCEENYVAGNQTHEHRAVIQAIDIIHRNYHLPLSISSLAKQVGISVWHLSKLFRKYTGQPPQQFLLRYRIDIAKKMIMKEQFQMKEIAYKCGFSSLQQFSRTFKQLEGYSPSQFLR